MMYLLKLKFRLILLLALPSFNLFSQSGIYDVTFQAVNTPVSAVPNDPLYVTIFQGSGIPAHGCAGSFTDVYYELEYYLVDQNNLNSYFIGSDDLMSHGVNCMSTNEMYWTNPGIQDVTVPCYVPTGDYWLRIKINNFNEYVFGAQPGSQPFLYGTDVNIGSNVSIDYLNNANPNGNQLFSDLIDVTIVNPNSITDIQLTSTNTLCASTNGTATVLVNGGVGPFTYEWYAVTSNPNYPYYTQFALGETSQTASGLAVGNYSVTVTDQSTGCLINSLINLNTSVTISYPYDLDAAISKTDPCTYDEGIVNIGPVNGVGPYSYLWNNGSTSSTLTGVTPGNYSVTIVDANGCQTTNSITLNIITPASYFDYPNGLTITSPSQTLVDVAPQDGIIRFRGPLIIKSGVNYTINNKTLEFARDLLPEIPDQGATHSGVIVEHKAKLTATNCTFKGVSSCDAMWQGIQVWGDDHYKTTIGTPVQPLRHGELVLTNSTVRDAHIGIALYRVNVPYSISALDHGRGILKAKFSTFLNNRISVDFKGRSLVTNNSYIKECNFTCNESLIDATKYFGEGSDVFIRLSKVKNPVFNGNTFNGNLAFASDKRATGIRSYDAGYVVQSGNAGAVNPSSPPVPNVFTNLSQGIDVYSTGGAVSTVRIKDNRFNNVFQGITASGSNFDEISFNVFNTPMGETLFNSWGMFMQTSSGFLATENTLNTLATNQYTFGIVNRNVNSIMGEVYKNDFNGDFQVATQMEGTTNNQLQVDCNRYDGTNNFDWKIYTVGLNSFANQGECLLADPTLQATNIFGTCSTSDDSQISSLTAFTYSTDPAFAPNCKSSIVTNNNCSGITLTFQEICPVYEGITVPCPSCVAGLQQDFNNTPPGLERDKIKGELIRNLAQEGNVQDLVTILTSEALPEDMKIIIPTHIQRKEFSEARMLLNSLDQNEFENQKFYELFDVLTAIGESERELDQITVSEKLVIEDVANSGTQVSIKAEAILAELDGSSYIRFPEMIPMNSAMMISNDGNINEENVNSKSFTVYPNPGDKDVTIQFVEAKQASGQLVDAMGRKIRILNFDGNSSKYELLDLAQGVYTLAIQYSNGTVETQRIVIK